MSAASENSERSQSEIESEIRTWLTKAEADDPYLAKTLGALRTDFPDQYHGLIRRAGEAWRKDGAKADGRQIGAKAIQDFVRANQKNIAFAPTPHLVRYAKAQARLMEVLHEQNVRVCARMAIGEQTPSEIITPDTKVATAELASIMIHAARAGIDSPQSRKIDRVSERDALAYVEQLKLQKLPEDVLETLVNETVALASPKIQCEAGLAHARAVANLDSEAAANITAFTLMP